MLLDNEDVHLKAGDVVVQRGTNHAWSNRGSETCIIAFVLVDAVTSRTADAGQNKGIPRKKTLSVTAANQTLAKYIE